VSAEHVDHFVVHVKDLTGPEREQLHGMLLRAAAAPSITENVAAAFRRAAAGAYCTIPEELTRAAVRRRMDEALTPDGRVRSRWQG
jgi:hypothetical protein